MKTLSTLSLLTISVLFLTACDKKFSCVCKRSDPNTGEVLYTGKPIEMYERKKSDAQSKCSDYDKPVNVNNPTPTVCRIN